MIVQKNGLLPDLYDGLLLVTILYNNLLIFLK